MFLLVIVSDEICQPFTRDIGKRLLCATAGQRPLIMIGFLLVAAWVWINLSRSQLCTTCLIRLTAVSCILMLAMEWVTAVSGLSHSFIVI
jgi:hypothetical protein